MNRTLNVMRMQLINRQTYVWVPLVVLGGAFVITLAIFAVLKNAGVDGTMFGGAAQAPLWYFMVVGTQALTLTFPFSQAMSVTRREFYIGTLLLATITSAMMAVVFVVGGLLEGATDGWGMNGHFFRLPWLWEHGTAVAGLFFFVLTMFFFVVGFWGATLYKRFGTMGLTLTLFAIAVVLVGAMWVIGQLQAWGDVFEWFATQGVLNLTLWGLLLTALLAASSFPMLRRLVP